MREVKDQYVAMLIPQMVYFIIFLWYKDMFMLYSPFEQFRDKVLNYINGVEVAGNRFCISIWRISKYYKQLCLL